MNFVFISPNFPTIYSKFVRSLKERGVNVLGIGDTPYHELNDELRWNITEYYFVNNLSNLSKMIEAVGYFQSKYGHIDFLESNNEFWLEQDAILRQWYQIDTGFYPNDMDKIKYKSQMKKCFIFGENKVARFTLSHDFNELKAFAEKVGYPLFAKPDNGVGASGTFKLNNEEDLFKFANIDLGTNYIVEEYIDGDLVSFDGTVNLEGDVVFCLQEHFPIPISNVVHDHLDVYYYDSPLIDPELERLGRKAVKAFGITKRNFHIEYFRLKKDKKGLGKKGEYIALEANMRSPGGETPELISIATNRNYYNIYADVICFNEIREPVPEKQYIAVSVSRRDQHHYVNTYEQIFEKYKDHIVKTGRNSPAFAEAMGDSFFYARFDNIESALKFKNFVLERQ